MAANTPDSYFFTEDDLPLVETQHIFAESTIWHSLGMADAVVTMDLVVRDMPPHRNVLVFAGLEEMVHHITHLRFSEDHIAYLREQNLIHDNLIPVLRDFRFSGNVLAMKEGSLFFPKEPVVRVTAPIIEANMISDILLNSLASNAIFASKLLRCRLAAPDKVLLTSSLRPQAFESGAKGTRASLFFGMTPLTLPYFNRKYRVPVNTPYLVQAQHVFIKSFPDELTAMRAMAREFPDRTALMIDTYSLEEGVENALTVARELREQGHKLHYLFVDSKPLLERTRYVRKRLEEEGFGDVPICAGANLDELHILELERADAPIDIYCAVTETITSSDAPKLEVVYKMAEMRHKGQVRQTAKLSPGKESYPGVKQVFRQYGARGTMVKDVIALESEACGEPLLHPVIVNGEAVSELPSLAEIKTYVDGELKKLSSELRDIEREHAYPVEITPALQSLFEEIKQQHFS